jgi:hypothetical protein
LPDSRHITNNQHGASKDATAHYLIFHLPLQAVPIK